MLPRALADWIAEQGHDAEHVGQLGFLAAQDRTIWDHALSTGVIIVTKDEDFKRRRATSPAGPQIVWLRIGNARREPLLRWFESAFAGIIATLERGDAVVEVVG